MASSSTESSAGATTVGACPYPWPMRRQSATPLAIDTRGRALCEIARPVAAWVAEIGATRGLVTLFIRHTSAGLLSQENARQGIYVREHRLKPQRREIALHSVGE